MKVRHAHEMTSSNFLTIRPRSFLYESSRGGGGGGDR